VLPGGGRGRKEEMEERQGREGGEGKGGSVASDVKTRNRGIETRASEKCRIWPVPYKNTPGCHRLFGAVCNLLRKPLYLKGKWRGTGGGTSTR
jgi:hypothetical protein